jgi:hypothetical protein
VVSFIRELSRKGTRRRKAIARSKVRRAQTNPGTFQTFLFTQLKEVRPICVRIGD